MVKKVGLFKIEKIFCLLIMSMLVVPIVSAGVGIKWSRESVLVGEKERTCLSYNVYNPWPRESYVTIELSDEIKEVLTSQEAETKFVPSHTPSNETIPIEFCFEIPIVYDKDCWVGGKFICKQECGEEQKVYAGEVLVKSVPQPVELGGTGGSVTTMAVSAPLKLKIQCNPHSRNFGIIYVLVMTLSLLVVISLLYKKYRKPKIERDKEKLKKLQSRISKAGSGKQKK